MPDIVKIQGAARDVKGRKWYEDVERDSKSRWYDSHPHEKFSGECELQERLLWWVAHRLAKIYDGKAEDYVGSVAIRLNRILYNYDKAKGSLSGYMMCRIRGFIERTFLRYESEGRAVNWIAAHTTDEELKELQVNYAFHEAGLQLYRIPDPDDDWAQEIIENFESPQKCFEFLTSDLNKRSRDILKSRYSGVSLREIGESYGLTRERIRQIEVKAMRSLREKFGKLETWIHLFKNGNRT